MGGEARRVRGIAVRGMDAAGRRRVASGGGGIMGAGYCDMENRCCLAVTGGNGEVLFCERLLEMARKISCFVIEIRKSGDLACYWAYHLF